MTGLAASRSPMPALLALAAVAALLAAGFVPVLALGLSGGVLAADAYLARVAGFTVVQAGLSTILSLALAVPVARALARRCFAGRDLIVGLLALPMALPAIVAVLGIVAVYGNQGWLGGGFELYGLAGILLAHVFFNFPLAARMVLARLSAIPPESFRLAAQLGFRDRDTWRLIDRPAIATVLPGTAVLVFLLCTASFTVVLTLGGGPAATTLEVAIYQALRFDFDPDRAVGLALLQLAICAVFALLAHRLGGEMPVWQSLRRRGARSGGSSPLARAADGAAIIAGLAVLLPPIIALGAAGAAHIAFERPAAIATATSLAIGACAAVVSVAIGWPLAQRAARRPGWKRLSPLAAVAALMMPPAVLATGWFVLLNRFTALPVPAPLLVVAMSVLMALPFVYNVLAPAASAAAERHDRLCLSLGIGGLARLRWIDLPALRRPTALALLLAAIVSLGDLTAIMLFGSHDFVTLPALIYRQMGSYRMDAAAGTALLLALLTLSLTALAGRWSEGDDRA
jgi:thiamine transport system permease protein